MESYRAFLTEEDGLVTIEWVALAAGVALLAIGIIQVLDPALETAATTIATDLQTYTDTVQ